MKRTYLNQFTINEDMPLTVPDFFLDTNHWTDESWGNEACPRFTCEQLQISVWVDYDRPADRELEEFQTHKYTVVKVINETELENDSIFESDDWDETLFFLLDLYAKSQLAKVEEQLIDLLEVFKKVPFGFPGRGQWETKLDNLLAITRNCTHS